MSDSSDLDDLVKRAKGKEEEEDEEEIEDLEEEEDDYSGESDDSIFTDSENDEPPGEEVGIQISDDEDDEVGPSTGPARGGRGRGAAPFQTGEIDKAKYNSYLEQKPNEPTFRYRIRMAIVSSLAGKGLSLTQTVTCSEAITNKLLTGATYGKSFEDFLKTLR